MSPAEIRRRALLAAAKVTFSFLAFGCGGADEPGSVASLPASSPNNPANPSGCAASTAACAGTGGTHADRPPAGSGQGSYGQGSYGQTGGAGGSAAGGGSQGGSSQAGSGGSPQAGSGGSQQAGSGGSAGSGGGEGGSSPCWPWSDACGEQAGAGGGEQAGAGGHAAGSGPGGLACGGDTEPPYEKAQLDCCVKVVEETFPSDPSVMPPESLSPEQQGCCKVVVTAIDASFGDPAAQETLPWVVAYQCCPYIEQPTGWSPTCTPWGPPTPPEMPEGLMGEAALWQEVA